MTVPGWLWITGAVVVGLLVVDRVLLWAESRGWIYYRRNKPRGGAAVYHFLEMSSIFSPSMQEVIEVKVQEQKQVDEDGDPLSPSGAPAPDSDEATQGIA